MITLGVSAVIRDGDKLLFVRRGREPYAGCWALPGGKVRRYEPHRHALVREVREETGLTVSPERVAGVAEAIDPELGYHFVIVAYFVSVGGGELRAGDDAAATAWLSRQQIQDLPLTPDLDSYLTKFDAFGSGG